MHKFPLIWQNVPDKPSCKQQVFPIPQRLLYRHWADQRIAAVYPVMRKQSGGIGRSAAAATAQLPDLRVLRRCGLGDFVILTMDIDLVFKIAAIGIIV